MYGVDKRGFRTICWNCGSKNYQETISREYCPDCKIEFSYVGGGYANEAYVMAKDRQFWAEEEKRRIQEEEDYENYPV